MCSVTPDKDTDAPIIKFVYVQSLYESEKKLY